MLLILLRLHIEHKREVNIWLSSTVLSPKLWLWICLWRWLTIRATNAKTTQWRRDESNVFWLFPAEQQLVAVDCATSSSGFVTAWLIRICHSCTADSIPFGAVMKAWKWSRYRSLSSLWWNNKKGISTKAKRAQRTRTVVWLVALLPPHVTCLQDIESQRFTARGGFQPI